MLNGSSIMDTTILIESANNTEILGKQSLEHLNAIKIYNLPVAFVCMNKLDLIKKDIAKNRILQLKNELINTQAENADIIPLSANFNSNIDIVARYLANLKVTKKSLDKSIKMIIIRSFNINKINTPIDNIMGGVVGGTIVQGILKIGDKFIIKPGFVTKNPNYDIDDNSSTKWICYPLVSSVISINADSNKLDKAISGGLIGVCTTLDPGLTINNKLVGNILFEYNQLNDIYETLMIEYHPLDNIIKLNKGDTIIINNNACNTNASIYSFKKEKLILELLDRPICIEIGDKITISQNLNGFKIIGYGIIIKGFLSKITYLN
jgi:translation initiation factor 2 subunit 3